MITSRELTAQDWHPLNGLLATALELEPPPRVEWLAALPASEADLLPPLGQLLSPQDLTETTQFAVPPASSLRFHPT